MARKRTTITVQELKDRANMILEQEESQYLTDASRRVLQSFVEAILWDTGNYHGYTYMDWTDVYRGHGSRIRFG